MPSPPPGTFEVRATYRIGEPLGSGGFGAVYLGQRETRLAGVQYTWPVAIKILHETVDINYGAMEAATLAGVRCPQIIPLLDAFETQDKKIVLVMEYVEGKNLHQYIRENGPISPVLAVRVGLEVCRALRWAHHLGDTPGKLGYAHTDVKPSNILLGVNSAVRLADFGLGLKLGVTGQIRISRRGTKGYRAPEVLAGDFTDGRCDIYSLGVTLLEALTDHRPKGDEHPYECSQGTRLVKQLMSLDRDLGRLIDDMLERDWQKRPNAAQCVERFHAVERVLALEPGPTGTTVVRFAAGSDLINIEGLTNSQATPAPQPIAPRPALAARPAQAPGRIARRQDSNPSQADDFPGDPVPGTITVGRRIAPRLRTQEKKPEK